MAFKTQGEQIVIFIGYTFYWKYLVCRKMQKYENGHFYKIFRPFLSSACMQNVFYKEYRSIWNLQKKSLKGDFSLNTAKEKDLQNHVLKKPGSLKKTK